MNTLSLFARVKIASGDIEILNKIIDNMSKEISMVEFSKYMCSICPYMCNNCDFCFMLFKYNIEKENYKKIIKKLVFSFYYGLDVSTLTFLNYYICPVCTVACKNIYANNDNCSYDYLKQFDDYKPMFFKPVCINRDNISNNRTDRTIIKFDHEKGILVTKKSGSNQYKPLRPITVSKKVKPHILVKGKTMTKIINNLWNINETTHENNSQTRNNNT